MSHIYSLKKQYTTLNSLRFCNFQKQQIKSNNNVKISVCVIIIHPCRHSESSSHIIRIKYVHISQKLKTVKTQQNTSDCLLLGSTMASEEALDVEEATAADETVAVVDVVHTTTEHIKVIASQRWF